MTAATTSVRLTPDGTGVIMPRVLTPGGIAKYLGVTPAYVRDLLREGRIRGNRLGGANSPWRVERDDFWAYLAQQKAEAALGSPRSSRSGAWS